MKYRSFTFQAEYLKQYSTVHWTNQRVLQDVWNKQLIGTQSDLRFKKYSLGLLQL